MKRLFPVILLLFCAIAASAQVVIPINNAATTGTVVNETAIVNSSNTAVIAGTSNTAVPTYIVTGGAGVVGQAQLAMLGQASCVMDATVSGAGWYWVINSTTTAGYCHPQSSAPSSGTWVIGYLAAASTTSGFAAQVNIDGYIYGGGSGSSTSIAPGTILGNNTGSTAAPTGLSASAVATMVGSYFDPAGAATTAQAASLPRSFFTVGTGGVTANRIVGFDASGNAIAATGTGWGGLAASTVAAAGTVEVVRSGIGTCVFDGAAVIGDVAIPSTTTPGECHDAGVTSDQSVPSTTSSVGLIESAASGAGVTGTIRLHEPGSFGVQSAALSGMTPGNIPVAATSSTVTQTVKVPYVDGFPSTCTVGGTPYASQLSCAFYQTLAAGGSEIVLGAGNYSLDVPLVEPTLGTQISVIGQVEGFNGLPTQITASASMQAMFSHPDILTSQSSPYNLRLENVAFNANNLASQCIALYAEKLSVRRNVTCRNAASTSLAHIQFGDPSPPGGYQSSGYQNFTEHVYDYGAGNGNSSWATVTPSQTGGTPSIAVSAGGTYVNPNPPVFFWGFQQSAVKGGSSATTPCTTMGTATAVMSGTGPYSVSSVTMSGYSGCSGLLYAYIPDIGLANYGIEEAETDSHFFDLEVQNAGEVAGIHYSSGSDFIGGDHVYGGSPTDFRISNPQKAIVGLEADTTNIYGIRDDSGKNVYTSTEFVTPQLGSVGFYATNGAIGILGSTCGSGSITSNNFTLLVTSSGAVGHGSTTYPGEVIDATQCDDLSKVDYIPTLSTSGVSITGGGNISSSSGTVNAVEFILSSGIGIQTSNATNVALTVTNNNATPTADLLDFKSGASSSQIASVDYLGNAHFANTISALSGDATTPGGTSGVLTFATVDSSPGSFGSTTNTAGTAPSMPNFTVNAKGLITASAAVLLGTAASYPTGTSGATVPLLNGANTWSSPQTLSSAVMSGGGCLQNGTSSNAQFCPNSTGPAATTSVAANVALKISNTNASPSGQLLQVVSNATNLGGILANGTSDLPAYEVDGTIFSVAGCGTATSLVGGSTAGKFVGGSATCTPVVTMGGAISASNGWACTLQDLTTGTAAFHETAYTATTVTFTAGGTVGATDTMVLGPCQAF